MASLNGIDARKAQAESYFGNEIGQLVCAMSPALMKTHFFVCLAISDYPVAHADGIFCFPPASFSKVRISVMDGFSDGSQAFA